MGKSIQSAKTIKAASRIRFSFKAARPSAGNALASYTAAFLQLSGLDDGAIIPAKLAREMMGDTAFGYHTRNGNIERTPDGVKLSEQGFAHFGNVNIGEGPNRNIRPDPEMIKAYATTMETGKPSDMVKNDKLIHPVAK